MFFDITVSNLTMRVCVRRDGHAIVFLPGFEVDACHAIRNPRTDVTVIDHLAQIHQRCPDEQIIGAIVATLERMAANHRRAAMVVPPSVLAGLARLTDNERALTAALLAVEAERQEATADSVLVEGRAAQDRLYAQERAEELLAVRQ